MTAAPLLLLRGPRRDLAQARRVRVKVARRQQYVFARQRSGQTKFPIQVQALVTERYALDAIAQDRTYAEGAGVLEVRIHYGPGYRVYIGRDGERIIVLLGGGTKQRQQREIDAARNAWRDYWNRRSGMKQQEE